MTKPTSILYWLGILLSLTALFLLFQGMLTPFIIGLILAYALNPAVSKLTHFKLPRGAAAGIVVGSFVIIILFILSALAPLIQAELTGFVRNAPTYAARIKSLLLPLTDYASQFVSTEEVNQAVEGLNKYFGNVLLWIARLIGNVLESGFALANVVTFAVIIPVISFYMLKDWQIILEKAHSLVPRSVEKTVLNLAKQIDTTMAGFARGQALVCLAMACYYSLGLSLIKLPFSFVIGIATGLLACVPYIGFTLGTCAGLIAAAIQFGEGIGILQTALVFAGGIALDAYVLTPKLVGDRIGLHPIWIIFAVFAGSHLKGLTGVIIALPLASALGVIVRFGIQRYKSSSFYKEIRS